MVLSLSQYDVIYFLILLYAVGRNNIIRFTFKCFERFDNIQMLFVTYNNYIFIKSVSLIFENLSKNLKKKNK